MNPLAGSPLTTPDFSIFTGAMELHSDATAERPVVRMIGSSTERDIQGDVMQYSALQDMSRADLGLSIWLNHDYTLPDSLFGSLVRSPEIKIADGIADIDVAVEVELTNPNAARTFTYIQRGRRLGCSVGCTVEEYELLDKNDPFAGISVTRVRVVEWSVVGIPANQRSWVENALKGLFARTLDEHLAPAVKGLFPREYDRLVEAMPDDRMRKHYAGIPARPATRTLLWNPIRKTFLFDQAGRRHEVERAAVSSTFDAAMLAERAAFVAPMTHKAADLAHEEMPMPPVEAVEETPPTPETAIVAPAVEVAATAPVAPSAPPAEVENVTPPVAPEQPTPDALPAVEPLVPTLKSVTEPHLPLLAAYNQLGATMGFPAVRADGTFAPDDPRGMTKGMSMQQMVSTVSQLDHHSDRIAAHVDALMKMLSVPDYDEPEDEVPGVTNPLEPSDAMRGYEVAWDRVIRRALALDKAGREFSATNQEHLKHAHDALAKMCSGAHCKGFLGVENDADGHAMANTPPDGKGPPKDAGVEALAGVVETLAKSLSALNITAIQTDVAAAQQQIGLIKGMVADSKASALALHDALDAITARGTGRPTHVPPPLANDPAVALREDLVTKSAAPAQNLTLGEALKLTTREYVTGIGTCRRWPAGMGRDVRPTLTSEQKSLMDIRTILAYVEGEEALVPDIS